MGGLVFGNVFFTISIRALEGKFVFIKRARLKRVEIATVPIFSDELLCTLRRIMVQ